FEGHAMGKTLRIVGVVTLLIGVGIWLLPSNQETKFERLSAGDTWRNWGETTSCRAKSYTQPHSEEEIIQLIQNARKNREKVKVVGSAHSFTPLICSENDSNIHLIQLDNYDRLISLNLASKQVTVQAGMRISKLNSLLAGSAFVFLDRGSITVLCIGSERHKKKKKGVF